LIRRAADATFRELAPRADTDGIVMWFDAGGALQVPDESSARAAVQAFEAVPGLVELVEEHEIADRGDAQLMASACELALEALVARRKISRSDGGRYGRAPLEQRKRPNQDLFGGGLSA
ncbi:MAG: magnesium chelatase, partial [Gemmatimonadaceae bacterium]